MALNPEYAEGATPLNADELSFLIPKHIRTQNELNEWEQLNILHGESWARKQRKDILTQEFLCRLHKKMFDHTWSWAGRFRTSNKNIGTDWQQITLQIHQLLDNVKYQIENNTYPPDELAARFHHRLVSIHPFPNGNGRHARLYADLLIQKLGHSPFSWGGTSLLETSEIQKKYIEALRAADHKDFHPLLDFVRS